MNETKIIVAGAAGRMGQAIITAAREEADMRLAGAIERAGHPALGESHGGVRLSDALAPFSAGGGVLIDFTSPAAALENANVWAGAGLPMVIGTTGLSVADRGLIEGLARRAAIVMSGNFSLGINLLTALVRKAAAALPAGYDIEIVDAHHRAKVDAPSGTALMLGRAAAAGRNLSLEEAMTLDRSGARREGAIGFAVVRAGGVIGDHDVIFAGASETLTLSHRALDRGLFAKGALAAARWVKGRPPGLYSMTDVLGL
jgi:4-hydroxy-tetrahydrodipicolinate reductase